jgi:putative selenium metabolism protein SsnA
MTRTLWRGGPVYTGSEVFADGAVIARGPRVEWAGPRADLPGGDPAGAAGIFDEVVDLRGRLLGPGWVNAHTHAYSALARGIALKDPPPADFLQILQRLWWRLDRALTLEDTALSAQLHGWECLRSGVTTIFDHHSSQRSVRGSLRAISTALEPLGLRACLCFEVSDRDGPEAAEAGVEENLEFLRDCARGGRLRRGLFGLHAPFTLSDGTLARCAREGKESDAGFHLHVAEDRVDADGVIDRLESAGILGAGTLCVHGVHLSDADLDRLAASRTWLVHCPESNLNNAVGLARLDLLQRAGVRLALGTDGFTADLCREALVGHLAQNHQSRHPGAGWGTLARVFPEGNAELASGIFGETLGRLRAGAQADLVVWDYRPPTPITTDNVWGHLLFGLASARADDVWVDGSRVLAGGRATGLDEEELFERCRRAARDLWERF